MRMRMRMRMRKEVKNHMSKKSKSKEMENLNLNQLDEGLKMRAKAKMMEDEAKVIKAEANEMLETSLNLLGLKDYAIDGIGKVALASGKSTSMSKEKLTMALLEGGVAHGVVVGAIEKATKVSYYTSVKYTKK